MLDLSHYLKSKKRTVSMVPLIDIVFILLLFFILTKTVVADKQLSLDTSRAQPSQQQELVTVWLENDEGLLIIDGLFVESADPDELSWWIQNKGINTNYVVDIHEDVSTQGLITLLDRMKQADASNVTIELDK
ncbi:MAG: biopolymer transporter ExbD [Gammaproteobacteria bacterium]|nr:biopolymer transporter ExbD [Gammaproteobacteria bacterium]MXW07061.1 biopolymer transporter ExbD [Gammaproteobacteria bacterium]MYC26206.1 biopolymer transporter ExbD [Gammaproteobacteria bacterium]